MTTGGWTRRSTGAHPSSSRSGGPLDPRRMGRFALGALLITAGVSHLTWSRTAFLAQVPEWVPADADAVVLVSGVFEVLLGAALVLSRSRWTGRIAAAFFVAVFPGNIAQLVGHKDAFGLTTDTRRAVRLLFQPVLVAWALWSTARLDSKRS